VDHRRITAFYTNRNWQRAVFDYVQHFDLEGVRGRLLSSSYAPPVGTPQHEPMMDALTALFYRFQVEGRVSFLYETRVFYSRLTS